MLVAAKFTSGSGHIYQGLNVSTKVRSTEEDEDANGSEYGK